MINFISSVWSFLSGKKTYLVGLLMIALGYLQGNNQLILEGLGLITLRSGVTKATSSAPRD